MAAPILTFFNNKRGVGKTSLVYHLAWMYAELDTKVVVVDLDPQANLTAAFLTDEKIESLWDSEKKGSTIYQCVAPLTELRDISEPQLQKINDYLYLIPGDIRLADFEEFLSDNWPNSMGEANLYGPMRILSSFWQVIDSAIKTTKADMAIVDVGPNLGAINRSALFATDYVALPLGVDLFSLQGLKRLGPALRKWRKLWKKRLDNWNESEEKSRHPDLDLPKGLMKPIGYICQRHSVRFDRPVQAYVRWAKQVPDVYRNYVLGEENTEGTEMDYDPKCLAKINHYRSLVPMAQEHRKPIFHLTPADGAVGSHAEAAVAARKDFKDLTKKMTQNMS